jgi:hypothetical protein
MVYIEELNNSMDKYTSEMIRQIDESVYKLKDDTHPHKFNVCHKFDIKYIITSSLELLEKLKSNNESSIYDLLLKYNEYIESIPVSKYLRLDTNLYTLSKSHGLKL